MNKIYIFSGLGVDKRVFEKMNFSNLDVEFVDWIEPLKSETLQNYAKRISKTLIGKNPILIGLSFGGILAVEISKIIKTKKVILIASAKNRNELPCIYKIAGKLKLHKLIPTKLLKNQNFITNWMFGIRQKTDKQLLKTIFQETNSDFLKWAINEITTWQNKEFPENYIHIHGSKDRILPIKNVKTDYVINNGGHFMTVNKANEIEQIIINASS